MRIVVEDLHFTYPNGVTALEGISLTIEAGERVGIVGQNGAGKTTLVKHFNGLLQPTRGTVRVGDWDTRTAAVARLAARVGYVFQNPDDQLFSPTVEREVAFGPRNLGFPANKVAQQVEAAIALAELTGKEKANPYDLTPTWRKMVALASVIAMDTPVLVLDEPTTGQDATGMARTGRIVESLNARGKTVVTITHDIDFCAEHFSRMIAMGQGRILLDGPTPDVLAHPEALAATYVELPQLTRLGNRLGLPAPARTEDEFLSMLRQRRPAR